MFAIIATRALQILNTYQYPMYALHLRCIYGHIPYSRKYWWELNLVIGSQIAIAKVLADLNLVVQ